MEWLRKVGQRGKDAAKTAALKVQDQLALPKDDDDQSQNEEDDMAPFDEMAPGGRRNGSRGSVNELILQDVDDAEDANQQTEERALSSPMSSIDTARERELASDGKYCGIANKTYIGIPHVHTGTVGPARAARTTLALQEIWSMFDEDRDGWLTEEQVYRTLRAVGVELTEPEKKELRRELEDDLALWSDSDDSATASDASVASDDDDVETVYEDAHGRIKAMYNDAKGTMRLLKASHHHAPTFLPVFPGKETLDRDKPEQIPAWCAATATPGLSLAASVIEVQSRTAFVERVHDCQAAHEGGTLLDKHAVFLGRWNDRSLDLSEGEEALRKFLKDVRTKQWWTNLFGLDRTPDHLDAQLTERTVRRMKALEKASVAISARPVLDRVTQVYVETLLSLDAQERRAKYVYVYRGRARGQEAIAIKEILSAFRDLGAPVNSVEVKQIIAAVLPEDQQEAFQGRAARDVVVREEAWADANEAFFLDVVNEGKKDKVAVYVIEAADLPIMDRFNSSDPFVTVEIEGRSDEERRKTSVRKRTLMPAWSERLVLLDAKREDTILVSVWDNEMSGFGASLIGEFRIHAMEDLLTKGSNVNRTTTTLAEWFPLLQDDGRKIIGKFGSTTKLHCQISYIEGTLTELKMKPPGLTSEFTLVTITIKEADHLPKMDHGAVGSVDPYCLLVLGEEQKFRTRTCKQTYSPSWEESFTLVADADLSGEVLLQMYDWDDEGKDECIGQVKLFLSGLAEDPSKEWFDLRSVQENSFVIGQDKERARVRLEIVMQTAEELKAEKSQMEILFDGMASDNEGTILECCSALWQMLSVDEDGSEREGLSLLPDCFQVMANVLLAGVLEVEAVRANFLPRMDYFGLCDPYLTVEMDSYSVKTEVVKTNLDPEWNATLKIPVFQPPPEHGKTSDEATITVKCYDWDKVGEHDLIGSIFLPLQNWDAGGPGQEEWKLLSEPENVRAMRPGEPDKMVRSPVIGHVGKGSTATIRFRFNHSQVCSADCQEEVAWGIAFSVLAHPDNARAFGETLGGIAALSSLLRFPMVPGSNGEALQAAAYALGNLAAAHRPNQDLIGNALAVQRMLHLVHGEFPLVVKQAACLSLGSICADHPNNVERLLACAAGDQSRDPLTTSCGGIGTLLVMIRDARPDASTLQNASADTDLWGEVANACEAAAKAIAATSFVNSGLFGKGRKTVVKVAVAVGRPGLRVLKDMAELPTKSTGKHATVDGVRFARLSYESLEAAYGSA